MLGKSQQRIAGEAPIARSDPGSQGEYDVVIVGGGIAGLSVALSLPSELRVALVTKAALGESNTRYAQGGLAAAVGLDDDPELHLRDTLAAGAGLVDERAARVMVSEAREAVDWLIAAGTHFDERTDDRTDEGAPDQHHAATPSNAAPQSEAPQSEAPRSEAQTRDHYDLALEAAHSRHRVLHAKDATGAEIERALVAAVRARSGTRILEHALVVALVVEDGICRGADLVCADEPMRLRATRGVVLANGGTGRLWLHTSNPSGATGDGLSLAWQAGATLADLEFTQFHPTVLVPPPGSHGEPFLISEAVRGEGAYLRNAAGERFMARYAPQAELAPRDVVARAIMSEMLATGAGSAWLDLRHLDAHEVAARFPTIAAACHRAGLDLARDLIPVAPAAHYFMGGVAVDLDARSTVPGLYAVGEVACTGVHGANRLASNSLLEGLVFGRRCARALAAAGPLGATSAAEWPKSPPLPGDVIADPQIAVAQTMPSVVVDEALVDLRGRLRRLMWEHVSLRRNAQGLATADHELRALARERVCDPETASMLSVAQLIVAAAASRTESRGGHYRTDFPDRDPQRDGRHTLLVPGAASSQDIQTATRPEGAGTHA